MITTTTDGKTLSASITIDAPPAEVFAIVADTAMHPVIDGSGTVRGTTGEGKVLTRRGDRFGMSMRMGLPYLIRNRVVEFEEDRRIAWRHPGLHRWRYSFEATPDGTTLVTETFDWSQAPLGVLYGALGFLDGHRKAIPRTLERLKSLAETGAVS